MLVGVLTGCAGGGSTGLVGAGGIAGVAGIAGFGGLLSGATSSDGGCIGFCADVGTGQLLSTTEVAQIVGRAQGEATARGVNAVIAVVDRVGNVLAVVDMSATAADDVPAGSVLLKGGNSSFPTISAPFSGASLDNLTLTNDTVNNDFNATGLAAVSKAVTAAYLSTEGNAFTTRTANQIVQENFNPGEGNTPGGPLFGVQFSQLACSDLTSIGRVANSSAADSATRRPVAPRASPFGLSADPGGLPLYKNGVPVGGIGVLSDGVYGTDINIANLDIVGTPSNDEAIALAGTFAHAAPSDRRADRITVDGKTLRFTDVELFNLRSSPGVAAAFVNGTNGFLVDVGVRAGAQVFFQATGGILQGQAWGKAGSGLRKAGDATGFADTTYQTGLAGRDAFVLVDGTEQVVYEARGAALAAEGNLTQAEVQQLMLSALDVANSARAQIRRPVNSQMRGTVSIVGLNGAILALARTRDGPLFGTDVSLQKARTAAFFSRTDAGTLLENAETQQNSGGGVPQVAANTFTRRMSALRGTDAQFTGVGANALADGTAFADRSGGNLARPFFPDGIAGNLPGPLSHPIAQWSPFATGLQLDLVFEELTEILLGPALANKNIGAQIDLACAKFNNLSDNTAGTNNGLQNGMQIFPGSVPIYKNGTLVGGIGVSGDGIDQDDMVSLLGTHNAGVLLSGSGLGGVGQGVGNAPTGVRADARIAIVPSRGGSAINLRYVQCPQNPFLGSTQQNVCNGK